MTDVHNAAVKNHSQLSVFLSSVTTNDPLEITSLKDHSKKLNWTEKMIGKVFRRIPKKYDLQMLK